MRCSPYSNSGLQNSASNGQTSTQIPQYMQSAKSMSKRSRAFFWRGLPPSRRGGARYLWPSM